MKVSLSKYFPKDTEYFYSFPAGEQSNFFNSVPAWKEELVAARPLLCAGPTVKVITFAATLEPMVWNILRNDLGVPVAEQKNIITLPESLTAKITGKKRNELVRKSLANLVTPGKFMMAQPYLYPELIEHFQIPPELSIWFNDKKNLPEYIPAEHLAKRYASFENGKLFKKDEQAFPFPHVVKVSSSSSGDGVRICRSAKDLEKAKKEFRKIHGSIIIEEFVNYAYNLGVQFGIPYNQKKPIEIIGVNEQLTTSSGEFLGAVVDCRKKFSHLAKVRSVLLKKVLPYVRKQGWYGVGGLDVLICEDGSFYFIDCNFRMTAMTAYLYEIVNTKRKKSLVTFTGTYPGNEAEFRKNICPLARHNDKKAIIEIITLTKHKDGFHFNAGMFFSEPESIRENARLLLEQGIQSTVLNRFAA